MDKLTRLRNLMKERGLYAYIAGSADYHDSEYVGEHFRVREYLSGFTGSAGTLVVTLDGAFLWTDSRYYIQAAQQLQGTGITLMKDGESGVPKMEEFLAENCPEGSVCGFDGRCMTIAECRTLWGTLAEKGISVDYNADLTDEVWTDRPPMSAEKVFAVPDSVCGKTRAEKLAEIRTVIANANADAMFISALDEIAWTLNLRGGDIEYCPLFLAYMLIGKENVVLFANPDIFSEDITQDLASDNIEIKPYGYVQNYLADFDGTVMVDPKSVSFAFGNAIKPANRKEKASPVPMMKSVKTSAEIEAIKSAHIRDGVAVTRFMKWLKTAVEHQSDGVLTEISLAEKLEEFRRQGSGYLGQSFAPIMAYAEHGAIVHYSATEQTNAVVKPHGLLLSDTGGHYKYGTTDVTRTFVMGELTAEERKAYTLVMAGHLNLLGAVFPVGERGSVLDYTAREPMWRYGMDYGHGTGHGVGFMLNVHEGPQRISHRAVNDAPFVEGMITSNEPGYYKEGKFGIRHESLVLCCKADFDGFLRFEPLTLVPFDSDGIDAQYLTERQIWLYNKYQRLVRETLTPHLASYDAEWLAEITKPI